MQPAAYILTDAANLTWYKKPEGKRMEGLEQARERVVEILRIPGMSLPDNTDARLVYRALCGQFNSPSDTPISDALLAFDEASQVAASLCEQYGRIHDARASVTRSFGYVVRAAPKDRPISLGQIRERLRQIEAGNDRIRMLGRTAAGMLLSIFDPAQSVPDQILDNDGGVA